LSISGDFTPITTNPAASDYSRAMASEAPSPRTVKTCATGLKVFSATLRQASFDPLTSEPALLK
jgi:hypothetical protein